MSYLFEIFPAIRCYYSDWFSFYFIYDREVSWILEGQLSTVVLKSRKFGNSTRNIDSIMFKASFNPKKNEWWVLTHFPVVFINIYFAEKE